MSLTGEMAAQPFNNLHANKLFLATAGISAKMQLTYPSLSDLVVKSAMIKSSDEVFLVADSSKIGNTSFASLGSISLIKALITDNKISYEDIKKIEEQNVKIIF